MEYTLTDFIHEAQRDDGDFYIITMNSKPYGYFRILSVDSGVLIDVTETLALLFGTGIDTAGWIYSPVIPFVEYIADCIMVNHGYDVRADDSEIDIYNAFIWI